eukprot:COSAG03_NODE_599_length_6773_cov_6.193737_9_plen_83_part_00
MIVGERCPPRPAHEGTVARATRVSTRSCTPAGRPAAATILDSTERRVRLRVHTLVPISHEGPKTQALITWASSGACLGDAAC